MAAISSSTLVSLGLCLLVLLQNPCGGSSGEYFLSGNASYISFPPWPVCSERGASIGLQFRTLRQQSLLFYVEDSKGKQHFVLAEIKKGRLSVEASLDDRINIAYDSINVSDGQWHQLSLKLNKDMLKVDLDDQSRVRPLVNGATTTLQALSKPIYVGGFPSNIKTIELVLYTVAFLNNFSGSIRDITTVDCQTFHNQKLEPYRLHGVRPAKPCSREGQACQNGGRCVKGVCDCTGTKFEGDLCEKSESSRGPHLCTSFLLLPALSSLFLLLPFLPLRL